VHLHRRCTLRASSRHGPAGAAATAAESEACWRNGEGANGGRESQGSLGRQVVSVGVPIWTDVSVFLFAQTFG